MPSQPGMLYARDVMLVVFFVQLASTTTVALAFGGLIYKILISRPELAAVITAFAVTLDSRHSPSGRFASFVQIPTGGLQFIK